MENESQNCPQCSSPYGYLDGELFVCPECFHEWSVTTEVSQAENTNQFVDVNGVALQDGDTVITAKDLKAGKSTIKSGTKVKNIRLLEVPVNGHDIACKVDGHGQMYLKCSVVRKA